MCLSTLHAQDAWRGNECRGSDLVWLACLFKGNGCSQALRLLVRQMGEMTC